MSLLVLAFANKENVNSHNWERSMIKYGYKHKLVGRGTKWVNFMTKIRGIYDYLQNVNDEYIVVIDAFDAFANKSSEGLLKTFLTFQADIVISAETSCGSEMCIPVPRWQKHRRRYINAGFYMGRREAIINLYKWLLASGEHDDKRLVVNILFSIPKLK